MGIVRGGLPLDVGGLAYVLVLLGIIMHVVFAVNVYKDATIQDASRSGPVLVGPIGWTGAVLAFGIAAVALYWVIHHSTLRRP